MRVFLAIVLLVTVAFALPVPEDLLPPPVETVGEYVVSPDKPLIVVVDSGDVDEFVPIDGDDDDDDDDDDDTDEDDSDEEDPGAAISIFCTSYPKALECQDVVILKPSIIDLAAPAVIPPGNPLGDVVVEEVLSVLPAPAVPVQPEISPLAEAVVQEVLTAIPSVALGSRFKRQARRGNRPALVGNIDYEEDYDANLVATFCAANPTETACLQLLGVKQTNKKKKKGSSESGSSSSEENDKEETEDILTTITRRCTLNPSYPGCRRRTRPSGQQYFEQSTGFSGGQQTQFAGQSQGISTQSVRGVQNGQFGNNQGFQQGVQSQGISTQSVGVVQNGQVGINQGF